MVNLGGYNSCLPLLRFAIDYEKLHQVTKILTENLNKVIDVNFYPTDKTKRSNIKHRPIGIGVQGLADLFIELDLPFNSPEAKQINSAIFETIYHAALEKSNELAKERIEDFKYLKNEYILGNWRFKNEDDDTCTEYVIYNYSEASISSALNNDRITENLLTKIRPCFSEINLPKRIENLYGAYSTFEGSPISQGIFQFDMWNVKPSNRFNWNKLRKEIQEFGLRNSLLVAPMPTASTSQILGCNECFEPFTSNLYTRRTLAGEFILVNQRLLKELVNLDIWNEEVKDNIVFNKGSIQYINGIPDIIKDKYKIVWEIPMKDIIDMAKDRVPLLTNLKVLIWMSYH